MMLREGQDTHSVGIMLTPRPTSEIGRISGTKLIQPIPACS